eukprot:CAMPEP_0176260418 /NCGR_PEP_ID=MMETSP0121_2-20121125/39573_1 /TAXON_ID=160619 /ORGANISM="Kryptoperidinium foliaceum, Strain CCMP 1326" /LENGTH=239 /DNA_ID=CAMNT_0017600329 /DNA_START=175 /DNA_END=893 /DNA_ORIENTATION=+
MNDDHARYGVMGMQRAQGQTVIGQWTLRDSMPPMTDEGPPTRATPRACRPSNRRGGKGWLPTIHTEDSRRVDESLRVAMRRDAAAAAVDLWGPSDGQEVGRIDATDCVAAQRSVDGLGIDVGADVPRSAADRAALRPLARSPRSHNAVLPGRVAHSALALDVRAHWPRRLASARDYSLARTSRWRVSLDYARARAERVLSRAIAFQDAHALRAGSSRAVWSHVAELSLHGAAPLFPGDA